MPPKSSDRYDYGFSLNLQSHCPNTVWTNGEYTTVRFDDDIRVTVKRVYGNASALHEFCRAVVKHPYFFDWVPAVANVTYRTAEDNKYMTRVLFVNGEVSEVGIDLNGTGDKKLIFDGGYFIALCKQFYGSTTELIRAFEDCVKNASMRKNVREREREARRERAEAEQKIAKEVFEYEVRKRMHEIRVDREARRRLREEDEAREDREMAKLFGKG